MSRPRKNQIRSGDWTLWADSPTDPDLAAHTTILHQRGIALKGAPIAEVFPPVPADDYLSAIWEVDGKDAAAAIHQKPVYVVLNLCRVFAYLTDGLVLSKEEGGRWGMSHLPAQCLPVVRQALDLYGGRSMMEQAFSPEALSSFASYMVGTIEAQTAHRRAWGRAVTTGVAALHDLREGVR